MKLAALLSFALTAAVPPTHADGVSDFRCGTTQEVSMANFDSVDAAFLQRSIAIVAASLANDRRRVRNLVTPDAGSVYFAYDMGMRSPNGPVGVIELIRSIVPRDYEWVRGRGNPPPTQRPCERISVRLTLLPVQKDKVSIATFKYERGLLVELQVNDADFSAGHFPRRSP